MTSRRTPPKPRRKAPDGNLVPRELILPPYEYRQGVAPQVDLPQAYGRQKVEAILRRASSLDSARELLGCHIVSATESGLKTVRITKTRSFEGVGNNTTNRDGISRGAGHVYLMKFRAAVFLNITTGREGKASCVWIEEATDLDTGRQLKNSQVTKHLGLEKSDGLQVFSDRLAIVPGEAPERIVRLSPAQARASNNTTAIFEAFFSSSRE